MSVKLQYIEVENFKSYKGYKKIGPLKPFKAVIGPNGSGKSNFMDAVSFVMGEKTTLLRVKRLPDLIHGASVGKPIASRASVTAIFEMENGEEKKFTRSILGSSADHKINNESVSSQVYLRELDKLGINAKAKNFLVFQELTNAKKDVANAVKELLATSKAVSQLEASLDTERGARHGILKQCKMDDINIPMKKGRLDQIDDEGEDASIEMSSAQSSHVIYEKEEKIVINYSGLNDNLKDLEDGDDVRKVEKKLEKQINDLSTTIHRIQAPNMKAMQKLDKAREKLQEANKDFDTVRRKAKQAKVNFERVKQERYDLFMNCFEHVSNTIDGIYKSLAKNQSAQAFLGPENPEEPYLEGINYNCVAPGKRFQPMSNLSGVENTIAALALLFAIHSFQPAPFFVLDEIDAALDNTNIGKVAEYINKKTESQHMNIMVISLKEEFYSHADALVGITTDTQNMLDSGCLISKVLTLDLTDYSKHWES